MAANISRKDIDKSAIVNLPIIWIMGGPGSGKGTQCERINLKFGFTHLSSGDLLRSEVMSGSTRGAQLYKLMSTGESVPNEIVDDLLAEAMVDKAKAGAKGFLIDGFPIDEAQAGAFTKDIATPKIVIALEAADEVLKSRLKGRGNFDDTDDSIAKRLQNYNGKTKPVIAKYNAKTVNAERTEDEIFADVEKLLAAM